MAQVTASVGDFTLESKWHNSGGAVDETPTTATVNKSFSVSGIPEGATISSAVLTFYAGTPYAPPPEIFTVNGTDFQHQFGSDLSVNVTVTGDGSYSIPFVFKSYGVNSLSDGWHSATLAISKAVLTVTYSGEGPEPEPEPEPEEEHIANEQIAVFPPTATDYSGNGLITLNPLECIVSEEAGGDYEVSITHPMDEYGKWQFLIEEYIVRCPVPKRRTPRIVIPASSFWRVKTSVTTTPLYSQLPYYTRTETGIDKVKNNPSQYEWSAVVTYPAGEYVVYDTWIYVSNFDDNLNHQPGTGNQWASTGQKATGSGSGGSSGAVIYHDGTVAENIPGGEIVAYVAAYNDSYIRVRSLRGIVGYIRKADCEQTGDSGLENVIEPRTITEQAFRIYRVTVDSESKTVTAQARHKSYDFMGNSMLDCKLVEADPQTAIAIMQGSLLNADSRVIACNISEGKISEDWSWNNPIYALLDPDAGLAGKIKAQVIRDNDDIFLLDNSSPDTGVSLHYGVNLLGVTWERSTDEVITRIVPRGKDKNGNDLFLDDLYIDSDIIGSYPVIRVEILDCDCKEGEQKEHADGTTQTLTKDDCFEIMEETAQKRFDDDKCDAVTVTLDVRFLLLGDTDEYRQYKGLQSVLLYDAVKIIHEKMGLESTAQVRGYSWDALRRRYNEITLGNIFSYGGRTVTGYNLTNGAVSWQKLAPGLIDKIRSAE